MSSAKSFTKLKSPEKETENKVTFEENRPVTPPEEIIELDSAPEIVKVEPEEVKSLLSDALDEDKPKPLARGKTIVLSEDRSPAALWHWAFRNVIAKIRMRKIGFSFMNGMLDREETVLSRLEKIEKRVFFLPGELKDYTDTKAAGLDKKIRDEVERLDLSLAAFDKRVCENFNSMGVKVADVTNDVASLTADLATLRRTVEEVMANQTGKMKDEIDELKKWRVDLYHHKVHCLMAHFQALEGQFQDIDSISDETTGAVGLAISDNSDLYEADPAESFTQLLTVDTNIRESREKLARLDAGIRAARPALLSLKNDLNYIIDEDNVADKLEEIEKMISQDYDKIMERLNKAHMSLKRHDSVIAQRWQSLSSMLNTVGQVSSLSSKIEHLETTVSNKADPDDVEEIVKTQFENAFEEAIKPMDDKQEFSRRQMQELTDRIVRVEEGIEDAAMEGKPIDINTPPREINEIRNSSDMANVSNLVNGENVKDLEAQIGPMVKNLVEMYCNEWENEEEAGSDAHYSRDRDEHMNDQRRDSRAVSVDVDDFDFVDGKGEASRSRDRKTEVVSIASRDDHSGFAMGDSRSPSRVSSLDINDPDCLHHRPPTDQSMYRASFYDKSNRQKQARNSKTSKQSDNDSVSSGRRGRGRGADPAEIQQLRQDVMRLNEKLTELNQKKIDVDAVRLLMAQKADQKSLAKKVDMDVVATIEDEVKACLQNIGDLRDLQGEEINELKSDLGRKIKSSLKAMFKAKEDESKGANASTKALCLTCGQESPMKNYPTKHCNPRFLPALNSNATMGPDIMRSGFKMPVNIPTKVSKYADFLDPSISQEISQEMTLAAAGGSTLSPEASAIQDNSVDSFQTGHSNRKQPLSRPSESSVSTYLEEQSSIRPFFRKGFPAKKSTRPSAYAPERYEPDPSIEVLSKFPVK